MNDEYIATIGKTCVTIYSSQPKPSLVLHLMSLMMSAWITLTLKCTWCLKQYTSQMPCYQAQSCLYSLSSQGTTCSNYTKTLFHLQHGAYLHKDHQQMSLPFFPNTAHHSNFGCHWQLLTQWILYTYWKHSHQLHRSHHILYHFQLPTHIWNLFPVDPEQYRKDQVSCM